MPRLQDDSPLYERDGFWVSREWLGKYFVYRTTITHSVRVAIYDFPSDDAYAYKRAVAECDRRAAL